MKKSSTNKNKDIKIPLKNDIHLEIIGNSQCIVDGLKEIVEYNKDKIIVCVGHNYVTFFGDELSINAFSCEGAIIEGNIISMEFSQYD